MPTLAARLQLLSAGPADATAAILLLALPRAASDELAPICHALAATGVPAAILGAVTNASTLDDEAQVQLAQALALSEPCLRAVVNAGADATEKLVALLARRERHDAPVLLARLVSTVPWQEPRSAAAEALLASLARLLGPAANPAALPAPLARRLDETIAEAVDRYPEHRCDAVLHAVALLARAPGPRLSAILEDAGHPAMFALRHAVGRAERPALRRQFLRLLTTPALSTVIQRNLHRTAGPRAHDDLLAGAHLLRAPARKRAMRAVDRPLRCIPTMTDAMALSREGQANMPLLIESLGLQTSKRLEHLADLIAIESTLGRLRAAMTLSRYEAEDARAALRPLTLDRSPWVARLAAHAALAGAHRDDRITAVAAGLLASPHPLVTRRARWLLSKTSSSLFFEHWMKLEQSERFAAARIVCAREKGAFVDELSAALNAGQRAERLSALTLASRLKLVSDLEQDIIVLAGSSDPHVASTAVAALGRHVSLRASEAVRVALRHTDARVRANAVESLARHDAAGALATIAALADHRHNRLRGNAVLALVRGNQPVGAQALRAMLADSDPMHRVSGIWVVGRANAIFARSDVRTLAERDGRIEIRKRAARTLRRIDHATRPLELTEAMHA